jgi:hypothetical protein
MFLTSAIDLIAPVGGFPCSDEHRPRVAKTAVETETGSP